MNDMVTICLEAIDGGRALEQVNAAMARIAKDTIDRDMVAKDRTVTLTLTIKPELDEESGINQPEISWAVNSRMPGVKGRRTRVKVSDDGKKLMVNPMEPGSPNQMHLDGTKPENVEAFTGQH